jgi:small subunit ribosomal protein S20
LANIASAKKRIRSSARRRERNRVYQSAARTYIKKTRLLIESGDLEAAEEMSLLAVSTLDKAARKGVVHPRNAARRKSRLLKALSKARQS